MNRNIFISYCSDDRDIVEEFTNELAKYSYNIWIDLEKIELADRLNKIFDYLNETNIFLFFLTQRSFNELNMLSQITERRFFIRELEYINNKIELNSDIKIIIIIVDEKNNNVPLLKQIKNLPFLQKYHEQRHLQIMTENGQISSQIIKKGVKDLISYGLKNRINIFPRKEEIIYPLDIYSLDKEIIDVTQYIKGQIPNNIDLFFNVEQIANTLNIFNYKLIEISKKIIGTHINIAEYLTIKKIYNIDKDFWKTALKFVELDKDTKVKLIQKNALDKRCYALSYYCCSIGNKIGSHFGIVRKQVGWIKPLLPVKIYEIGMSENDMPEEYRICLQMPFFHKKKDKDDCWWSAVIALDMDRDSDNRRYFDWKPINFELFKTLKFQARFYFDENSRSKPLHGSFKLNLRLEDNDTRASGGGGHQSTSWNKELLKITENFKWFEFDLQQDFQWDKSAWFWNTKDVNKKILQLTFGYDNDDENLQGIFELRNIFLTVK